MTDVPFAAVSGKPTRSGFLITGRLPMSFRASTASPCNVGSARSAFGAKRTCREGRDRANLTKMTRKRT